jgi:hypothetical protein
MEIVSYIINRIGNEIKKTVLSSVFTVNGLIHNFDIDANNVPGNQHLYNDLILLRDNDQLPTYRVGVDDNVLSIIPVNRTGSNRTGSNRTGSNRTGSNRTGSNRTGSNRTGSNSSDSSLSPPAPDSSLSPPVGALPIGDNGWYVHNIELDNLPSVTLYFKTRWNETMGREKIISVHRNMRPNLRGGIIENVLSVNFDSDGDKNFFGDNIISKRNALGLNLRLLRSLNKLPQYVMRYSDDGYNIGYWIIPVTI